MTISTEDRRASGAPEAEDAPADAATETPADMPTDAATDPGAGREGAERAADPAAAGAGAGRESISEVLASIRALVSQEARARQPSPGTDLATVLVLTPTMRADAPGPVHSGEILSEGLDLRPARGQPAPILDEEALRDVINVLVREELQGELGERISRNLRKLIRRELAHMLAEQKGAEDDGPPQS